MITPVKSCDDINSRRTPQSNRNSTRKPSNKQSAHLQSGGPIFNATQAMKAARTRAWKTYRGYSRDEIEDNFPATSFITLRASGKKLKQLQTSLVAVSSQLNELSDSLPNPETTSIDVQADSGLGRQVANEQIAIGNKDEVDLSTPNPSPPKRPRHDSQSPGDGQLPTNQKKQPRISTKNARTSYSGKHAGLVLNLCDLPSLHHGDHSYQEVFIADRNLECNSDNRVSLTDDAGFDQTSLVTSESLNFEKDINFFSTPNSLPGTETDVTGDIADIRTPNWPTRLFPIIFQDERFESTPELKAMAPVRDPNNVEGALKDAVQTLYEVQSQVHGFVPETQPLLIDKMTELARSLAHLQTITSPTSSPNNPIHKYHVAPEIIDYVDDSRNPDIYNREFVELVQRGNAVINGKQQAFRDFSEIFAQALKQGFDGMDEQVDEIVGAAGLMEKTASNAKAEAGPTNGANKQ